jgi:myosin heavy subunit
MDTLGFDSAASASGNYGAVNFGFDQFCATYAAEKLHYHYVRHSFHEEESAYRADGVELRGSSWSVDSNDDLLDLLDRSSSDSKPVSLLATLQVVTEQPSGTESTFRARLEEQLPQHDVYHVRCYGFCGVESH